MARREDNSTFRMPITTVYWATSLKDLKNDLVQCEQTLLKTEIRNQIHLIALSRGVQGV